MILMVLSIAIGKLLYSSDLVTVLLVLVILLTKRCYSVLLTTDDGIVIYSEVFRKCYYH